MTFPSLTQYSAHFDVVTDDLLERWMSQAPVKTSLIHYRIPINFFSQYFGKRIVEHTFRILYGKDVPGNCPIISVMLVYFEKKKFALEDIFELCSYLKNSMIECANKHEILTNNVVQEIALLMDTNLKGVIREYIDINFMAQPQNLTCDLHTNIIGDNNCMDISTRERSNATSAFQYLQEIDIDFHLLDDLNDIEEETYSSMDLSEVMANKTYQQVIALLNDYIRVLNQLVEFDEITYALNMLIDLLRNNTPETIGTENIGVIAIYIKAIISDLSMWRKSVFVDQNAEDIHYLDKTLLSSITQLQIMLSEHDDTFGGEIDFF